MRSLKTDSLFIEELTGDGSPTLRLQNEQQAESMHNAAGAASETVYIYGEAILEGQKLVSYERTQYLILGLGLGYIEMLVALLTRFKFSKITSFEKDSLLIQNFLNWFESADESIQDRAFQSLLKKLEMTVKTEKFKAQFKAQLSEKNVLINSELKLGENAQKQKYQIICYDAFSKKTDEYLWTFDFLDQFIKEYADSTCVFASYAKTGDLTRALKNNGFEIQTRPGFAGKRDSTLAIRKGPGTFISYR